MCLVTSSRHTAVGCCSSPAATLEKTQYRSRNIFAFTQLELCRARESLAAPSNSLSSYTQSVTQ